MQRSVVLHRRFDPLEHVGPYDVALPGAPDEQSSSPCHSHRRYRRLGYAVHLRGTDAGFSRGLKLKIRSGVSDKNPDQRSSTSPTISRARSNPRDAFSIRSCKSRVGSLETNKIVSGLPTLEVAGWSNRRARRFGGYLGWQVFRIVSVLMPAARAMAGLGRTDAWMVSRMSCVRFFCRVVFRVRILASSAWVVLSC